MTKSQSIYKVLFFHQNSIYEIYARQVVPSNFIGFLEVEELIFGEKSSLVVDPSEEKLKTEFAGVKRSYIPLHLILRVDEVSKEGIAKIKELGDKTTNVSPFPTGVYTPPKER